MIIPLLVVFATLAGVVFTFRARRESWIRVLVILLALAITGRMLTRYYAMEYGAGISLAFQTVGRSGFADTKAMEEFLASPQLAGSETRATALPFLGGHYADLIADLKTGMSYFSAQLAVPSAERYRPPPHLHLLHLDTTDPSDQGVAVAVARLNLDYRSGL